MNWTESSVTVLSAGSNSETVTIQCSNCKKIWMESNQKVVRTKYKNDCIPCSSCHCIYNKLDKVDFGDIKKKFVKKYMRFAKTVAAENDSCLARKIGIVIVRTFENGDSNVISTGYNGPPKRTPHCDQREYLEEMVWPQLTEREKLTFISKFPHDPSKESPPDDPVEYAINKAHNCRICPRRLVDAPSGIRLELCSCSHAEANAIYNASGDIHGAYMFCWCPIPCWDCGKAIVNAGIKGVFCVTDPSYGVAYQLDRTCYLFEKAGVKIFLAPPEYYLEND